MKIILFETPSFSLNVLFIYLFLNLLFLIPLINAFNLLVESIITFSLLICVSKLYVETKGSVKSFKRKLNDLNPISCIRKYLLESLALGFAHLVMGVLALFLVFLGLLLIAILTGTSIFLFNFTPPLWLLAIYLVFLIFVYFSLTTSYPTFFARVIFEAKKPREYFYLFITAPVSKLLLRISFSFDILISSLVVGFASLLLTLFKLFLLFVFPPSILLVSFLAFINMLLVYLFGVVMVGEFVWKKNRR